MVHILFHGLFLADEVNNVKAGTIVDHIDYVVNLAGIDHVGLGSDFDGRGIMPIDLNNASKFPKITQEFKTPGVF
ncbi:MAG: hypothetical protein APF76_13620 [Desulfitibacter sp. BRH_c19]|nr:MAG: hypothetical protein APF76_13620 [Desulfitibacter sp. BRH_c19]